MAADIGLLSPALIDGRLRFAATASNLGSAMKFDQARESLPLLFKGGSSYQISRRWLAAVDLALPKNDRPYAALGSEYRIFEGPAWRLAGRAGFNSQTIGSVDGFTGVSLGMGIGYGHYAVDYGFVPIGGVGQTHRLSPPAFSHP